MAGNAGNLVFGMTAGNTSHMGRLIQMAGEADLVRRRGSDLRRIADIGCGHRFRVFTSRTVAGFAGFGFKAALFVGFHLVVRILLKCVKDVLVARLAGLGADEFRRLRGFWRWSGGARFLLSAPGSSG